MSEKTVSNNTLEQKETQTRKAKHALSLCFIGFGFYWAWLWVFAISSVPAALTTNPSNTDILAETLARSGFAALALLAGALLAKKLSSPVGEHILVAGAWTFGLVSTALIAFFQSDAGLDWISIVASLMMGVSRACFILLWGKLYSTIGMKRATIYMSGSVTLGAVLYLVITSLPPIEAIVITLLLPIAAVASYLISAKESKQEPVPGAETSSFVPLRFWRLFLGIGIYAIAFAFIKDTLFTPSNDQVVIAFRLALIGVVVTGLIITTIAIKVPRLANLALIYRLILPITAVGFLLIVLLGIEDGSMAIIFVMIGFTVFDILTWLVLANASARLSISPYQIFGFGRFVHFLGLFIGGAIVYVTSSSGSDLSGYFAPLSVVMVIMLIVASTLVLTENEFFGKGLLSFDSSEDASSEDRKELVSSPEEKQDDSGGQNRARWRARCEGITREYNLSPREGEILTLLAKGRDTIFIQNELGVSNHTVRSHVFHIYQKLDVHSRQELLDFIEQHDDR